MRLRGARERPAGNCELEMETVRTRLMVAVFLFIGVFVLLSFRMVGLGLSGGVNKTTANDLGLPVYTAMRADIIDRNGIILATNLEISSLFADPKKVQDPEGAIKKLTVIFPDLAINETLQRLKSDKRFVWIKRKITPKQMYQVNTLGLPGFSFQTEEERIYPQDSLFAHTVGYVDVDGRGLAGIEHYFDDLLQDQAYARKGLQLSMDVGVQHALWDEMARAVEVYQARGAAGIVVDVNSGEVLAMVSLPDFDPNAPSAANSDQKFNRAAQGVYELGSIFKTLTVAMALETGAVTLADGYDATYPLKVARFTIRDDHPKNRYLTVPEIFIYSSNIGAAQMALDIGTQNQQDYFGRLGLFNSPYIEITEVGRPIYPAYWREINTMTAAYGHGIAVSPLQMASAIATTINGGNLIPATLILESEGFREQGTTVFSPTVSDTMRMLMRLTVTDGTGTKANVPGYLVGGKTGTAEKPGEGSYQKRALMSSFVGIFPMNEPRYLVLIVIDEPIGTKETYNFASGGWVAAPAVGRVIARIAPMLGVSPEKDEMKDYQDVAFLLSETP